jgi:predicted Fe-Mo cluster-binding NifX family protein
MVMVRRNEKNAPIFIAVPTNDGNTIFPKMLGMAKYLFIYRIEDGLRFRLVEKRINPFESTMQHLKTIDVYGIISDCKIIIAQIIGKKGVMRLKERGMKLFFRRGGIKEAIQSVLSEMESGSDSL